MQQLFQKIASLREQIEVLRPLSSELEGRILQKFRFDWNFHSNSIEGNKLTYGETKTFLLHGLTAKGKPLKDHLDIQGHNEVVLLLDDIIKENRDITELFIKELHSIILKEGSQYVVKNADGSVVGHKINIGQYKTQPNHVRTATGETHYFASPEETAAKMGDLISWYRNEKDAGSDALLIAALFHYRFISIHPFDDGNGRLARILMNLILMQQGFPPVVIKTEKKEEYYSALQQADGGDESYFVRYIGEQLCHSLNLYLKGARGENIEDESDIDKQIAFLKASLSGEKEKIVLLKDEGIKIYFDIIKPILEKSLTKLEQFDDLFFEKEICCHSYGGGNYVKDQKSFFVELDSRTNNAEKNTGRIGFEYKWKEFKKSENINFNCSIELYFDFQKYNYIKITSHPSVFHDMTVHYREPKISDETVSLIITSLAKYVLQEIEKNILL